MRAMLEQYREVAPRGTVEFLRQLGQRVEGKRMLHVNSTRQGGGVAEILQLVFRHATAETPVAALPTKPVPVPASAA